MNFEEHAGKPLLAAAGIPTPPGGVASSPEEAAAIAAPIGQVIVKAQVPTGKRGKSGGILPADDADGVRDAAGRILGMTIGEHRVERVLVEGRAAIAAELYCAVLNDPASGGPMVMVCPEGGMDIEEITATRPDLLHTAPVDIRNGFGVEDARALLDGVALPCEADALAGVLASLYRAYRDNDAELLEVNPLAVLDDGSLLALDCKFTLEDSSIKRREALAASGVPDRLTGLEERGQALGLKFIELDGNVGVLANGAGLTMTTMDVIAHHGGRPANFLEIGGESYTKAKPGLELVLANPGVKSLVVNFCGAFARTDVMTEGVIEAWEALAPKIPVFFSVHGTGAAEARRMLRERLDIEPLPTMDDAVREAVAAATGASR